MNRKILFRTPSQKSVSHTTVTPINLKKAKPAAEPTDTEKPLATSVRKTREKAEKVVASPKAVTVREKEKKDGTRQAEKKPAKPIKLRRQESQKHLDKLKTPNDKKEKPSTPVKSQKTKSEKSVSLFSRKKKPAPTIPSAAQAVQVETTQATAVKPHGSRDTCCLDMMRIFSEAQFEPLRQPLLQQFDQVDKSGKVLAVCEVTAFLAALSAFSETQLPTVQQAQQLFDTYLDRDAALTLNLGDEARTRIEQVYLKAQQTGDTRPFYEALVGSPDEPADDDAVAVLPQLAAANWPIYQRFLNSLQ